MVRGSLVVSSALLASVAASSGCTGGECGIGTVRYGDTCVAVDPFDRTPPSVAIDPPLYTRSVGIVRLTSDEPATIYYTIDGTEPTLDSASEPDHVVITGVPDDALVRFFAIDLNGNRSAEGSRAWIIDREGPGAPGDFTIAVQGTTRTVTWTPPPDPRLGGVIVARVEGDLVGPVAGQPYAEGDELAPGITVVHRGADAAGSFSETREVRPGIVRYVAWAFDEAGNYGAPSGAYELIPFPPQTTTVTVDAGTGTVATLTPASHVAVTGASELTGSTLRVTLAIRNDTTRVLFAPKLRLRNALAGVTWSNADGELESKPYRAYGAALPPGATIAAVWTFTGASVNTDLILDLDVLDNRVLVASYQRDGTRGAQLVDAVTAREIRELQPMPGGSNRGSSMLRGAITPDGMFVSGGRSSAELVQYDLATGERVQTVTLRPQKGHIPQVVLDASGSTAYALAAEDHWKRAVQGAGVITQLVRLDASTLTETGRLTLGISRNRDMQISPDGRLLAIATALPTEGTVIVDLSTFQIRGRIVAQVRPQAAMFTPDSKQIVIVGETITVHDAMTLAAGPSYRTPATTPSAGRVLRATLEDANRLWIGRRSELAVVDLRDGTAQTFPRDGRIIEVFDGIPHVGADQSLVQLDAMGVDTRAIDGFTRIQGHWVGRSPF